MTAVDRPGGFRPTWPAQGDPVVPWLLFLAGLAVPISTAATSILFAILLIVFFVERPWPQLVQAARLPAVWIPALFFCWLALSLTWNPYPVDETLDYLKKYVVLLYFLPLVPLLHSRSRRDAALAGFLLGAAVTLAMLVLTAVAPAQGVAIALVLGVHDPVLDPGSFFKLYLGTSFILALAAFCWLELGARRGGLVGAVWLAFGLASVLSNFVLSNGRTGQVVTLALVLLWLVLHLRWKGMVLGLLAGAGLVVAAYSLSSGFQARVQEVVDDVAVFEQDVNTPVGLRLAFWQDSLGMIRDAPLLGSGVGSIPGLFRDKASHHYGEAVGNPHNEYLAQALQGGAVAVLLMLATWAAQAVRFLGGGTWGRVGLAVLAAMAVGSLANSLLLDHLESHLYALLAALAIAAGLPASRQPVAADRLD